MTANGNLVELRRLLADRFPEAHRPQPAASPRAIPTGVGELDRLLQGGLPQGAITELVGVGPGSGTAQVVHALLDRTAADRRFLVLVDGADSFDIDAPAREVLSRLLWIRCRSADEALKATDLILRDRNPSVVALDLALNPPSQLRRLPPGTWHRFERLAEHHGAALLVITPFPLVATPAVRLEAKSGLGLETLGRSAGEVVRELRFELVRSSVALRAVG